MAKTDRTAEQEGKDAIAFLRSDHSRITKQLTQLVGEGLAPDQLGSHFTKLAETLAAHEFMEEESFYPAVRRHKEGEDVVRKSLEQHHAADELLERLKVLPTDDPQWRGVAQKLDEGVREHIDFEQGTVLPLAQRLLDEQELQALGVTMRQQRSERLSEEEARQEGGGEALRQSAKRAGAHPASRKSPGRSSRPSAKPSRRR